MKEIVPGHERPENNPFDYTPKKNALKFAITTAHFFY
jgi:hypothetical protein